VQTGLVSSFNRPGGNITGIVQFGGALGAKRLELLQQLVPKVNTVSLLINPDGPTAQRVAADVQSAAQKIGLAVRPLTARDEQELNTVFKSLHPMEGNALLVGANPFFLSRRALLVSLAAQAKIPTIYDFRDYVEAGGLMSYGASLVDAYRQLGIYAGRILKGEKPADLPILQPTKFEFVINLRTAMALGLAIPDRALALADEVIE
jgi:putative ABC transport system substrate-binding protein